MKALKAVGLINLSLAVISVILISSCSDDVTNTVDNRDTYQIKVWDYSDNHYFLDTVYKASFLDFFNSTNISQQTANLAVDDQTFEVWVQTDTTTIGNRKAGMHIDLPYMPVTGYDDSLKIVPAQEQGVRAFVLVRKLSLSEYEFNKYAGYVSLKINLPDNYFAGVAYKRKSTNEQFGTISTDTTMFPSDTLVLKMVKVQSLIPQNTLAWELKIRNIYQLPKKNIVKDGFEFDVNYLIYGVYTQSLPVSNIDSYLITILGLDKYTDGRSGPPDNKFDYLPSFTIDAENGWIIFPSLKPFLDNMQGYNNNGVTIDPAYWYPEIYNSLKSNAKLVPNANNYIFQGYLSK